ncbi:hypothetical protein BT96DRAFT_800122, partial [Gymnopus androsaceus JB14]
STSATESSSVEDDRDHSIPSTKSSFAPGQAAFSSTPAGNRAAHLSDDPSWSASLESPLVMLDREIRNFSQDADETESSIATASPTPSKKQPEPLLRNLLRQ